MTMRVEWETINDKLTATHEYLIGILENKKLFCGIVWLLEAYVNDSSKDPPSISHVQ